MSPSPIWLASLAMDFTKEPFENKINTGSSVNAILLLMIGSLPARENIIELMISSTLIKTIRHSTILFPSTSEIFSY